MSAFCVFGMTEHIARQIADERTPYTDHDRNTLPEAIRAAMVEEKTQHLLQHAHLRQISPAFDAPQFADDWLRVARSTTVVRGACVMVRGAKTDDEGTPRISKRTGTPLISWIPYLQRTKA